MRSFPAQFVAAVLALGTNVARPSDALMSAAAFTDECYLGWYEREAVNLSDAHLLSRCVPYGSSMRSREQAEASSAKSVSDSVRESGVEYCGGDLLGTDAFAPYIEAVFIATLAQALHLPATSSCAGEERGSCPLSRPLCNGTLGCVRPTCGDVTPLCNDNTDTGAMARFVCGVTCGCGDLTSDLLLIGPNSGCLPKCQEKAAKAVAETATCADAQPGSAELAALLRYSGFFERQFPGWSATNATVRAELGCFALNFDYSDAAMGLCDQEYWNATKGAKSLLPYCPASCGCIGDPSKPGCPRACRAPEPPVLRDLSDAQLAVANAAMGTFDKQLMAYPPTCLGITATDCDALLTSWHRHPCPVACGIDPGAAST